MNKVATLYIEDAIGLDQGNLDTLYNQLGFDGAEDVMRRAIEELATRLADLRSLYEREEFGELARRARSLIGISEQVGLTTFARVAGDVAYCAQQLDLSGLAATLGRLERVGDRSLAAVWNMGARQT